MMIKIKMKKPVAVISKQTNATYYVTGYSIDTISKEVLFELSIVSTWIDNKPTTVNAHGLRIIDSFVTTFTDLKENYKL